jgi:hypothetical protein
MLGRPPPSAGLPPVHGSRLKYPRYLPLSHVKAFRKFSARQPIFDMQANDLLVALCQFLRGKAVDATAPSTDTDPFEYLAHPFATKVEPRPNLSEGETFFHIETDDLLVALDEILALHVMQ